MKLNMQLTLFKNNEEDMNMIEVIEAAATIIKVYTKSQGENIEEILYKDSEQFAVSKEENDETVVYSMLCGDEIMQEFMSQGGRGAAMQTIVKGMVS